MESELRAALYPSVRILLKDTGKVPVSQFGDKLVMGYTMYITKGTLMEFLKVPTLYTFEFHTRPQKIVVIGDEGKMQTLHISKCRDVRVPVLMPDERGIFHTPDGQVSFSKVERMILLVHLRLGVYFLCYQGKTEQEILSDYKQLRARELDEQLEQISRKIEGMSAED